MGWIWIIGALVVGVGVGVFVGLVWANVSMMNAIGRRMGW